jgi:hypothetical protein
VCVCVREREREREREIQRGQAIRKSKLKRGKSVPEQVFLSMNSTLHLLNEQLLFDHPKETKKMSK